MTPTPFLKVIAQRHDSDCAAACLAMLLGESYESVILAFGSTLKEGISLAAVKRAAKKLGVPLKWSPKCDLENDTGILTLASPLWHYDHLVILKDGLIIDTDATIWECDVFLSAYQAKSLGILTKR